MFSWYQIESDSAASPVSCKSYLASTDSETFAAVITFQSCKTRSRSISDRRAGLIKLYIHESISSNWTGLYFILSEHPHTVAFSVFFLMQCYFLFQTESELEWFQEGSRLCKLHLLWEKCEGWRTRGMQRNSASVYAKKNTKSMDENGVKGKKSTRWKKIRTARLVSPQQVGLVTIEGVQICGKMSWGVRTCQRRR